MITKQYLIVPWTWHRREFRFAPGISLRPSVQPWRPCGAPSLPSTTHTHTRAPPTQHVSFWEKEPLHQDTKPLCVCVCVCPCARLCSLLVKASPLFFPPSLLSLLQPLLHTHDPKQTSVWERRGMDSCTWLQSACWPGTIITEVLEAQTCALRPLFRHKKQNCYYPKRLSRIRTLEKQGNDRIQTGAARLAWAWILSIVLL